MTTQAFSGLPIFEWAVSFIIIIQAIVLIITVAMIAWRQRKGTLRYSESNHWRKDRTDWVGFFRITFVQATKLSMPIMVFLISITAFFASNGSAIANLFFFPVRELSPMFWLVFNVAVSLFLYMFDKLAVWQFSCISLRQYKYLEDLFYSDEIVQKAFLPLALTSVYNIASSLVYSVRDGKGLRNSNKRADGETNNLRLRNEVNGILDIENTKKSIAATEGTIERLLLAEERICQGFFALNKWPGDKERILEELYLSILNDMVCPLLKKTQELTSSVTRPVKYPMEFVKKVWTDAIQVAHKLNEDNSSEAHPMATSLISFERFYSIYDHRIHANPTMGIRPSEKNGVVSKAKRIFILSGNEWINRLLDELVNIKFGGSHRTIFGASGREPLPRAIQDNELGNWGVGDPITHLAWCVELHFLNSWDIKFISLDDVMELWGHAPPTLLHQDFMLVPLGDQQLVFSIDVPSTKWELRALGDIPAELCPIQVSLTADSHSDFYEQIYNKAEHPSQFITKAIPENQLVADFVEAIAIYETES